MSGRRVLFICGSLNQTTIMHAIANALPECECCFTPYYSDGLLARAARAGLLDFTILGGKARLRALEYFAAQQLRVDDGGRQGGYDLVVTCSDLLLPRNIRRSNIILVQEGMVEPEDFAYHLVKRLGLPRYLANTSMTGLSHAYQKFCVASDGYQELFIRKGVAAEKIAVTGIPNFDHAAQYVQNDFPWKNYVLAATSARRETFKYENRKEFILRTLQIAGGRQIIFKLHPNENHDRARREILRYAPQAMVLAGGNTAHMIANCEVLVTRYSSVVYLGLALNKEVHADIDLETLKRLAPIQNGGASAGNIADVCREYLAGRV